MSSVTITDDFPLPVCDQLSDWSKDGWKVIQYVYGFEDDETHVRLVRGHVGDENWLDMWIGEDVDEFHYELENAGHFRDDDGAFEVDVEAKTVTTISAHCFIPPDDPGWQWA